MAKKEFFSGSSQPDSTGRVKWSGISKESEDREGQTTTLSSHCHWKPHLKVKCANHMALRIITHDPTTTKSHSESALMTSVFLRITSITCISYWAEKKALAYLKHTLLSKTKLTFQEGKNKTILTCPLVIFLCSVFRCSSDC